MKTAPWKDDRRIGVGWRIPSWVGNKLDFGGRTVFREMIRLPDHSLGTAFVEEMLPRNNETSLEKIDLEGVCGIASRHIGDFPDEFRLDGTISFQPGTAEFGIVIMDKKQDYRRFVSFEPENRTVELDSGARIKKVELESGTVSFRLLRTKDVIDIEINGHRTLVSAYHDFPESFTVLYVRDGKASFQNLKIFTW